MGNYWTLELQFKINILAVDSETKEEESAKEFKKLPPGLNIYIYIVIPTNRYYNI